MQEKPFDEHAVMLVHPQSCEGGHAPHCSQTILFNRNKGEVTELIFRQTRIKVVSPKHLIKIDIFSVDSKEGTATMGSRNRLCKLSMLFTFAGFTILNTLFLGMLYL